MKMQMKDIGARDKAVLKVLYPPKSADPVADMYRKIRDAAMFAEDVPAAFRVAALELVKAEIVRNMQDSIDADED